MRKEPKISKEEVEALKRLPNPFVQEPWGEFQPKLKVGNVIQYGDDPHNLYEVVGLDANKLGVDLISLESEYWGMTTHNYSLSPNIVCWKLAPPLSPPLSIEELL